MVVDLVGVGMSRPGRELLDNVDLTIHQGDRVGIVGINGTGKSTLMGVISGRINPNGEPFGEARTWSPPK